MEGTTTIHIDLFNDLPRNLPDELLTTLLEATNVRIERIVSRGHTRRPKDSGTTRTDEWVVASALAGGADVLVTGDAAIMKLGKRAPLPILSPRGLWELIRGPEPRR